MIVVMRFDADESEKATEDAQLAARIRDLLTGLANRPGFEDGRVGRSPDEPGQWVVLTTWASTGQFRRALSDFGVKVALGALASNSVDQTSVFETVGVMVDGDYQELASDRAASAGTSGPLGSA